MARDLAQRVNNAAAQQKQQGPKPSLRQQIERMRPEIARALPKHMDPDRVARIAITLIGSTPKLAECTAESFLGALMTASQLGLEPGPLGEAYLVPYGRTCTFIPGYRGLIKLAWQSGQLRHIDAQVVRDADDFDYAYGLEPFLRHKPARTNRGQVHSVYACATFLNGGSAFVVMSVEDVEAIRKRSKAAKDGPWVTDWDAMARKTAIRQLARFLPMSQELRNFAQATALDGTARTDWAADLDDVLPNYVDGELVDDEPAAPEADTTAADATQAEGRASREQLGQLDALLPRFGVRDRGARLELLGELLGQRVVATTDLTAVEAGQVLELLERLADDADPARALDVVLAQLADDRTQAQQ